ncbi:MAG: hypothetical protein ACLPKE_16160 [Streptosporangiaceae bacterium]
MSGLTDAMIINGAVLAVVLEADLGPHRKIGWFRIARPLVTAAVLVPIYFAGFSSHGTGLILELVATAAGLLLGVAVSALMRVYRSPRTGKPVSRAGFAYAALWIAVIGARAVFSWGSVHWFGPQLSSWMASNAVTVDALTDALLLMALAMTLTRTLGLVGRAARLPARTAAAPQVVPTGTKGA